MLVAVLTEPASVRVSWQPLFQGQPGKTYWDLPEPKWEAG